MTPVNLTSLEYDSVFAPTQFWGDYNMLTPANQQTAHFMLGLDELYGCWLPPPYVDTHPISTPLIQIDIPTPTAVPEIPTTVMLMVATALMALLIAKRRAISSPVHR